MQIELIAPATWESAMLPRMGLGIVAALTPPGDEVVYTDEIVRPLDLARDVKPVDLVGISVDSRTVSRSYAIADAYRRRGVAVVLGGIHVTACPEEASAHADAVVAGEAEAAWPRVLADFKEGALRPLYRAPLPSLAGAPAPRRDLFRSRRYIPFEVVQTMRGCPYPCEFCSVSTANGTTMRFRPPDEVLAELRTVGRRILLADDNVMIHRGYSRELFTRMIPLRKHWVGQCSLAGVRRPENVRLMAESGCKALFIGFESIDDETVRRAGKRQNRPAEYKETIDMLHDQGIAVWGSFLFGFDTDGPEVFDRTVEFAIDMRLTVASFAMLTPYPGTALYRRLRAEGRLTHPRWWLGGDHDADSPYYRPARMTREQLHEGWVRAWTRFYSYEAMRRRFTLRRRSGWVQNVGFWPLNLIQRRIVRRRIIASRERGAACARAAPA